MEMVKKSSTGHCLVLSYPAQGHINPMLQFSKRLQNKGLKVTFVTTQSISNTIHKPSSSLSIAFETISDGYDDGDESKTQDIEAYLARFWDIGSKTLTNLVERLNNSVSDEWPVDCIIYDAFMPWGLDVGKKFGLFAAAFFTQSCAVDTIYYHIHKKLIKLPVSKQEIVKIPGLPPLQLEELPSFISNFGSYPAFFDMLLDQFSNIHMADWIFCNTFYDLEKEVVDWFAKILPFRTTGPCIPSMYLDKQLANDKDYGFSIFKPNNEGCMKWLNQRSKGSVAYVSFGSLVDLDTEQMEELASGLKGSQSYFLWVVRAAEEAKLPKNFIQELENSDKGIVVNWCQQLEVLGHEAIGCFVTHCGWNSSLEALSLGVPMVAMPQRTDQSTNSKFITDVWKVGVKVKVDEKGISPSQEIEFWIKQLLEGQKGKELKSNSNKWKELAKRAMLEGGSSGKNIDEFCSKLGPILF